MTENNIDAEREAWSQYLDARHAKQAAWMARCIAWGNAVRSDLRGEPLRRYLRADEQAQQQNNRKRELYRRWQHIAYPMFGFRLPDEVPEQPPES